MTHSSKTSGNHAKVMGLYRLGDGRQVIVTGPMSPEEVLAYRRQRKADVCK